MSNNEKQMNSDKIGFGQIFLWQSRGISNSMNIMLMSFVMIYCTNALGLFYCYSRYNFDGKQDFRWNCNNIYRLPCRSNKLQKSEEDVLMNCF